MYRLLILLTLSCVFSSCSVAMSANKQGTSISKIQSCQTKGQLISAGGELVSSEKLQDGSSVEIYRFKKETGSAARACMHGVLDVVTCGLWEVVGTPIEACSKDNGYISLKVTCDRNGKLVKTELE